MFRRIVTMLVILTTFGVSSAYAHDQDDDDNVAAPMLVAGLAFVTAAIIIASHDRHGEYRPAPRYAPDRSCGYRGPSDYGRRDGWSGDDRDSRGYGRDDGGRYYGPGHGQDPWYRD